MTWTIGKRISAAFAVTITITAAMGGFAWMMFGAADKQVQYAAEVATPALAASCELESLSRITYELSTKYRQTNNEQERKDLRGEFDTIGKNLQERYDFLEKIIKSPEGRRLYGALTEPRNAYRAARTKMLKLVDESKLDEAREIARTDMQKAYDAYMKAVQDLSEFELKIGTDSGKAARDAVASGIFGVIVAVCAAVVIGVLIAIFSIRTINKALNALASSLGQGASQVAVAAGQVSASSQSIAQGASEQAAALEETTAALNEMASMTKKNAEIADQASLLSGETKTASDRGNTAMERMSTAINDIQKSAGETAKIVKVIDEIAFQTNLLALNAAVEAARAGEAGKGFAVVAEEVRNLAQRSAEAAKNTTSLIEESVKNAQNGVTIAGDVGKDLGVITEKATKVNALIAEIAEASKEQARGIEQVNIAAGQMDQVTQTNAANAEESASASEELSGQAGALNQMVGELLALVGGVQHGGASAKEKIIPMETRQKVSAPAAKSAKAVRPSAAAKAESAENFAEFNAA